MLELESPFNEDEIIYACPGCKTTREPDKVCINPGCRIVIENLSGRGWHMRHYHPPNAEITGPQEVTHDD